MGLLLHACWWISIVSSGISMTLRVEETWANAVRNSIPHMTCTDAHARHGGVTKSEKPSPLVRELSKHCMLN